MEVYLKKIRLRNFKVFRDETIVFNKEINIFVGDNATGKSSILQAIDYVVTGSENRIEAVGLDNLFNVDAVSEWQANPTFGSLPEIAVELFLEMPDMGKYSRFNGEKYGDGKNRPEFGIKMVCSPSQDFYTEIIQKIQNEDCSVFPYEFYSVRFSTFADAEYKVYIKPFKTLFIDSVSMNTAKTLKYAIERTYENALDVSDRTSSRHQFRAHVAKFTLPQAAVEKKLIVSGDLESCLDMLEDGVRLANQGEGRISICKTDSALDKKVDDVSILSIEEPENHLSHYSLQHLIAKITERAEDRQVFIVTHSSYITARLGLQNAFFVNKTVKSLSNLSKDTSNFFIKAPNDNLLQFVLSSKVILVEGAAEYILMDRFIKQTVHNKDGANHIWIIALNNLSFRRYMEVAKLLGITVAVVRDNDGKPCDFYPDLCGDKIQVFSDSDALRYTFEVCLYNDNRTVLDDLFQDEQDVLKYMLGHKSEAAFQILKANIELTVPRYIKDAIEWIT